MKRMMRKTIGVLAVSAMIPVAAWAASAPPAAGRTAGPPQAAFDACVGKKAGDTVQFTNPRGVAVTGTCQDFNGKLAARPAWAGKGPGRTGRGGPGYGPGRGMGYGMGMGMGMGYGMGPGMMGMGLGNDNCYMTQALNLTPEQKTKVQALMNDEYKKTQTLHEQMWNARERFREASVKTPYDEAAVRKAAEEMGTIHTSMMVSLTSAANQVMALLTPEQKETAARIGIFGNGPGMGPGRGMGMGRGRGMGPGMGPGMGRGWGGGTDGGWTGGPGGPFCPWR